MKSSTLLFAATISLSGLALAQSPQSTGVTESTDPAKVAEIEQHAQQLQARAQASPATGQHEHTKKKGAHHHKEKAMPKQKENDKAPADVPPATERKN